MVYEIPAPMLAKAVPAIPDPAKTPGGLSFEPKWDGFRALVSWDGTEVVIGSRGAKPLTRYFPELVQAFAALLPERCLLDGEIVVATTPRAAGGATVVGGPVAAHHPAGSRVQLLSRTDPAQFVAFKACSPAASATLTRAVRRAPRPARAVLRGIRLAPGTPSPLHLTRTTTDPALAAEWLAQFEGAGLDGVVAKPLAQPYAPGKRTMLKIKHVRTADVVTLGYRVHKSGAGVGSLLVGLYDSDGVLRQVGGVSAFSDARRLALVDELAPLVVHDDTGAAVHGDGERSRFTPAGKDTSFVRLRPERVLEVRYDQLEGDPLSAYRASSSAGAPTATPARHVRPARSRCAAYDLADVLDGPPRPAAPGQGLRRGLLPGAQSTSRATMRPHPSHPAGFQHRPHARAGRPSHPQASRSGPHRRRTPAAGHAGPRCESGRGRSFLTLTLNPRAGAAA